jgi:ribose 5-phosphate isomerase B
MAKLFIASDHAGFELKSHLLSMPLDGFDWVDLGTHSTDSVDYPYFAMKLTQELKHEDDSLKGELKLARNRAPRGVLVCGSGVGVSIAANRQRGIRAVLGWTGDVVRLARLHNAANVLCLGGRVQSAKECEELLKIFLSTDFEGGRHEKRVTMLDRGDPL